MGSNINLVVYHLNGNETSELCPTTSADPMGVVGFVLEIISIVKYKDRALLTWLSIPIGLVIIFWTVAEIAFPH